MTKKEMIEKIKELEERLSDIEGKIYSEEMYKLEMSEYND